MAIAFRTEIDLKAHRASAHSKNLSKQQVRQARTLDLDFSYGSRGRNDTHGQNRKNRDTQREFDDYQENHQPHQVQQASAIDTRNKEQFPELSSNNRPVMQLTGSMKHVQIYGSRISKTDENFPQLPSNGKKSSSHANNLQTKNYVGKVPSSSSLFKPAAPTPAQSHSGKSKKFNNNKPKESVGPMKDDFPALGPASGPQSFTARPIVRPAPKPKPPAPKTVNNEQKSKTKFNSVSQNKKKIDLDDDDQSYPSLTPVPVGFTVKRSNMKFDSLVDNYATPLSMSSKIQTIVRSEDLTPKDDQKKSAPNLSSADNFPSLNGESSFSTGSQMWVTKGINQPQTKMIDVSKPKPKVKEKNHVNKQNQKLNNKSKIQQISYISIANSEARNETLKDTIMRVVNNSEMLQEFRNVSRLFVDGDYFPKSYYETCQYILGERFEEIFPELLVLLPSIERQQVRTEFQTA